MKVPKHIGIIPDGNRRWANNLGMAKEEGYAAGLDPGLQLFRLCQEHGVQEVSYYGFTTDNTKRPSVQTKAFIDACVGAVKMLTKENASLLVLGNTESPMFPKEILPYTKRQVFGDGRTKVNFLVNYGWHWDLGEMIKTGEGLRSNYYGGIQSKDVSRIDLVIRWGGRRRLSGFLPAQTVYSDFYIIDDFWPDFQPKHFYDALSWYEEQDVTLGG